MRRLVGVSALLALLVVGPRARAEPSAVVHWVGADGAEIAGLAVGRTPPPLGNDGDAFTILLAAPSGGTLPETVAVASSRAPDATTSRAALEVLEKQPLFTTECPPFTASGSTCKKTMPLRLVFDDVDRRHPLLAGRSLLAELGGAVTVNGPSVATSTRRVETELGRHSARLRVRLVRMLSKGPPPLGRDDEDAVKLAREEVDRASSVWGTCGISFGAKSKVDVKVVDPPPPFLLSLGCEAPAIATGGDVHLAVDGRDLVVKLPVGATPREAARLVEMAIDKMGFRATVSDNRATPASSLASADVLVSRPDGTLATLTAPKSGPVSTDGALDACIGRVALDDGLQHFTDADAVAGTLEERTLVKALDDGDPSTIEVIVIPSFGGDARIGESFIFVEHGAIRNIVLEDRAGFRAQKASFTLAHELGHVLLDQPGHPDDFAGDTPTSLMDSDAVNPTAFGPRRLSFAECKRAHTQSGPSSLSRIVEPWPLAPLNASKKGKSDRP